MLLAYLSMQARCRNLVLRCNLLISALSEDWHDGEGPPSAAHTDALKDAHKSVSLSLLLSFHMKLMLGSYRTLLIVQDKVEEWAMLGTIQSLLRQDNIREGVDELQKKVDTCIAWSHVLKFPPQKNISRLH